ncbi:MAG: TIGR01777 family oxidoreductase [Candidatus Hydrogenedentota bacterium]|nr:MAG: TIGR01777 family oxidoreductase [Candidatus Hydrogenedentota bacterium]
MKVLITGGLGFVGTQMSIRLLKNGHHVTVVDHSPHPKPYTPKEVRYTYADTTQKGSWQEEIMNQDAVINLAGTSIFRRWTENSKRLIYESRILTTRNVAEAMAKRGDSFLCSTSAVGYYGFRGDEELTEESAPGNDFLATLCVDWENEAAKAADKGIRVVIPRFGIVLGKTGGALGQMIPAFKSFVGGPLGSGNQWFSWVHMEDLLNALLFILESQSLTGPVNFCSPNPVRNKELARALGKVLSRPSFLRAPSFLVRSALGEFGSVLLEGQRVVPDRLLKGGFVFRYPDILDALQEVVGRNQ